MQTLTFKYALGEQVQFDSEKIVGTVITLHADKLSNGRIRMVYSIRAQSNALYAREEKDICCYDTLKDYPDNLL